ncbi:MAG TPA: trehalose-6-phosphate synthase [Candidatus Saccharimonadales bacterium]|nr:trehalose-6-phosphate synthase [Candidatus Saccharimonadales bacterium]
MGKPRVIIASNRLPVNIAEEEGELVLRRSVGGLATALGSVMDLYPMLWIGWSGAKKRLTKEQLKNLSFPDTLVPIAISAKLLKGYYDSFANGTLWPLMHGIKPSRLSSKTDWDAMQTVTTRFSDAIQENCQPDDVIWVHDYHLVLLPQMLRGRGLTNRIGFFLHTPFPPAKTLRRWKHYRTMLTSLSKVDVLGFQTQRDVDNFLDSLDASGITMKEDAVVQPYPIGIDYGAYRAAINVKAVGVYMRKLKKTVTGKKVILSVSRLDYTKGIIEQLWAVEKVIEAYGPRKAIYKLVVAPSRETVEEYKILKKEIDETVEIINTRFKKKYGIEPVEFAYRSHGFEELNAWYRSADVLLVTPKIDGMNLVVKEYIAARDDERGAIVLSQTIGAAFQLKDAILVDPTDIDEISEGLMYALTMPALERIRRWRALRKNVRRENVFWWTKEFLKALYSKPRNVH